MSLRPVPEGFSYGFRAMASPCEVRTQTEDPELATALGRIAEAEAARTERKYSRYLDDSALSALNRSNGTPVAVDAETALLLDYAAQCHELSGGRFDITSGVLRRVWRFDGSDRVPTRAQVREVLPHVGWDKAVWRAPHLTLRPGMEIDFGGLGKEYAVDTALRQIQAASQVPVLVNFGGDLHVSGPRASGQGWRVSIESPDEQGAGEAVLELFEGALATSGDARRYLLKDSVRYSHILDPRTGWPVKDPPRSVTVAAPTCMEAGILSTLAMLHGRSAEAFLKREKLKAWWIREET
jgi:thiamine biosynthesis lipoprotein